MSFYRQKLVEAVHALVGHGDLNSRLTYAVGCLLLIDDDDVPPGQLVKFEGVRDPLISKPMVLKGEMLPRDLSLSEARSAARAIVDLLTAEMEEA